MSNVYDAIVIGLGGMGSAALYQLARRGLRVLGIEQHDIAHDRGSSGGETRIIRRAYFEHPDYVPLVDQAHTDWATLGRESASRLLERTGLLLAGPADGEVIAGARLAAAQHDLAIDALTHAQCRQRFPGIHLTKDMDALFESDAGFLRVEECVRALVARAEASGAAVMPNTTVLNWSASQDGCVVEAQSIVQPPTRRGGFQPSPKTPTDEPAEEHAGQLPPGSSYLDRTLQARRLVICGGPWSAKLLADLRLPLEVRRKVAVWYGIQDSDLRLDRGFPIFGVEWMGHFFYGFPSLDGAMMKVADHTGGEVVADPAQVHRELRPEDTRDLDKFNSKHLPGITGVIARHSVCMYTMTPDQHFIVDRHPRHPNVCFAAGFSGHGFKFAPVIGSALADLATDQPLPSTMDFLKLDRLTSTSA